MSLPPSPFLAGSGQGEQRLAGLRGRGGGPSCSREGGMGTRGGREGVASRGRGRRGRPQSGLSLTCFSFFLLTYPIKPELCCQKDQEAMKKRTNSNSDQKRYWFRVSHRTSKGPEFNRAAGSRLPSHPGRPGVAGERGSPAPRPSAGTRGLGAAVPRPPPRVPRARLCPARRVHVLVFVRLHLAAPSSRTEWFRGLCFPVRSDDAPGRPCPTQRLRPPAAAA